MQVRTLAVTLIFLLSAAVAQAQEGARWRPPTGRLPDRVATQPGTARSTAADRPLREVKRRSSTVVSEGNGTLPREHGQVWREYDITPYTLRVTSTNRPEQAIVDWILRETGYETWHGEPVSLLSAGKRKLRVYHTPEVQARVEEIVERFVSTEAETQAFGLRILTVGNPNWRARAMRLMQPVPVQSQGVQAWLLAKEDAALLVAELRRRNDTREHSSPHLLVHNGQSTVVSTIRPRSYVKGVRHSAGNWPGYEPEMGQIEEGYALDFSPLLSLDGSTVDSIIKLRLNQVEKMRPVMLEVPTAAAPQQRAKVEVPQMTMSNLHERFRWPVDRVLLLSMGVVATPAPNRAIPVLDSLPVPRSPGRADALLFVESKGNVAPDAVPRTATGSYPGRY